MVIYNFACLTTDSIDHKFEFAICSRASILSTSNITLAKFNFSYGHL